MYSNSDGLDLIWKGVKYYGQYLIEPDSLSVQVSNSIFFVHFSLMIFGVFIYYYFDQKKRKFEDMPTSKVRSAAQGFVELAGKAYAIPNNAVVSKLQKKECIWYSYSIALEKTTYERGGKPIYYWHNVMFAKSRHPLLFDDGTGICFVLPDGARTEFKLEKKEWIKHFSIKLKLQEIIEQAHLPQKQSLFHVFGPRQVKYKFTEYTLPSGMDLYALGTFSTKSINEKEHYKYLYRAGKQYAQEYNLTYEFNDRLNFLDNSDLPPRREFYLCSHTESMALSSSLRYKKYGNIMFLVFFVHNIYASLCFLN